MERKKAKKKLNSMFYLLPLYGVSVFSIFVEHFAGIKKGTELGLATSINFSLMHIFVFIYSIFLLMKYIKTLREEAGIADESTL